jgi:hypothetical protein
MNKSRVCRRALAVLLSAVIPVSAFAATPGNSYNVIYDGGTVPNVKTGNDLKLFIDGDQIRFMRGKTQEVVAIPASAVTEISYGEDVHRRVGAAVGVAMVSFGIGALVALTKSKKHYVGITWDGDGQKGGMAIQCDKSDYRGVLLALEGITGKKAVDSSPLTVKN